MDIGLQMLISSLCGVFLVPVVQFLKERLNLQGEKARWLALLSSIVFSILVLLVTGKALVGDLKTVDFYLSIFGAGTNQLAYAVWKQVYSKLSGGEQ
jgi:predicted PurR-regulated permease PerM